MTTHDATVAAPATTAARRYSQQITTLTDTQTREYVLGLAVLAAEAGGYAKPREAEQVRDLLDEAIGARYRKDADGYERAVRRGRRELAEREEARRAAASETTERVKAVASSGA
jgi:hypothetical protein